MISFSIITVAYNAEQVIRQTLYSVYKQSYPLVEHIIIDNCSKDKTITICKEYSLLTAKLNNHHTVKIISEPDKGLYDAMNKGIKLASNDYVLFLNAGDYFPKDDTLETVAACVGEGEELPAVLYGDTDIVDEKGHFLQKRDKRPPKKMSWRSYKQGMLVCHQAFYVQTTIAKQIPYDLNYRYSSDVDWSIRVMKEAERKDLQIRNTNATIALFLDGGATTIHHNESLKERFHIMCKHYGVITTVFMHTIFAVKQIIKTIIK